MRARPAPRRRLPARLLALLLLVWAGCAQAQVVTDAAGLREIAGRLLAQGEAARARELAEALLARDPDDRAALLLLAQAALAEGEPAAALAPAGRAHALAPTGAGRFAAATLAARAHADLRQDLRAQLWLRRALGDAPDRAAAQGVARDYRALRARSPLAVGITFGLAPSSNVNGGSSAETVRLPGLPFEFLLDGRARALPGLRVSGGARLSYRLAGGPRAATVLEAQASGRTYVLSDAARARAPEARGSDFADVLAQASLVRRWRGEGASGPASAAATLGQSWYDGEPYLRFAQGSLGREVALGPRDRLEATGLLDWTERLEEGESYPSLGARGRWTRTLRSGDRASLSVELRDALSDLPDLAFRGATIGAGWERQRLVAGLRVGLAAEAELRDFGASRLDAGGRRDLRGSLRASVGLARMSVWGFEPTLGLEASRTASDVDLYDRESLSLELGFRSRL